MKSSNGRPIWEAACGAALVLAWLGFAGSSFAARRPSLHGNAEHYKQVRSPEVTGRSGSATLSVRALRGRDGKTLVELTTGSFAADAPPAPGQLTKVQLKAYDAHGRLRGTRNYNGLSTPTLSLPFTDLARGQPFQVQANERGIDGRRTDVVTVSGVVKLRPDLAVSHLSAPPTAAIGTPVNVSAQISERNGDVGANADCVLSVDGSEADRSTGIWVAPAGTVSCAFVHTFTSAGAHDLSVAVQNVAPADDDSSNDSASASITITQPSSFQYTASIRSSHTTASSLSQSTYSADNGSSTSGYDFDYSTSTASDAQQADFSGQVNAGVAFPITISVTERSDGADVAQALFTGIAADSTAALAEGATRACASRVDDATGAILYVCSQTGALAAQTSVTYSRYAGAVTYFSSQFSDYWFRDDATGQTTHDTWAYNDGGSSSQGTTVPVGTHYGFAVKLESGATSYSADAAITTTTYETDSDQPLTCEQYGDGSWLSKSCSSSSSRETGVSGSSSSAQ